MFCKYLVVDISMVVELLLDFVRLLVSYMLEVAYKKKVVDRSGVVYKKRVVDNY